MEKNRRGSLDKAKKKKDKQVYNKQ